MIDLLEFTLTIFFYFLFMVGLFALWLVTKVIYLIPFMIISVLLCYIIGMFEIFTITLVTFLIFFLVKIRFKKD